MFNSPLPPRNEIFSLLIPFSILTNGGHKIGIVGETKVNEIAARWVQFPRCPFQGVTEHPDATP